MNCLQSKKLTFGQNGKVVFAILFALNRRGELNRLIDWAEQKRVKRNTNRIQTALRNYKKTMQQIDDKLLVFHFQFPRNYKIARFLHMVSNLISAKPVYRKGSAAPYRKR